MEIVPLGPGFAAELRGVTLADVVLGRVAGRAARIAPALDALAAD